MNTNARMSTTPRNFTYIGRPKYGEVLEFSVEEKAPDIWDEGDLIGHKRLGYFLIEGISEDRQRVIGSWIKKG
jgi:hypothetical protein